MDSRKNRVMAGVIALFLGGLGIHKFYLGDNTKGFIYLLFSWTFIPAIVALFDAIVLFTMDDSKFHQIYGSGGVFDGAVGSASRASHPDAAAQIAEFVKLKEAGAITEEEYDAKKKELLGM